MRIRPFDESDFPAIVAIYARSKLDELVNEDRKFVLLPLEEDKKRLAGLRESDIFVCEDDGVIAYGAVCGPEIRAMFVHPDHRGKGLGKLLLEYLLSKIERRAVLYVAKTNARAKNLYGKFGFEVVEEFETTYNGVTVLANKMVRAQHEN